MSSFEISDNKWEVAATKPPIVSLGGLLQLGLMGFFALFFLYLIYAAISGIALSLSSADSSTALERALDTDTNQ